MSVHQREALLNTRAVYLKQISIGGQIIYSITLFFIILGVGSLPFLYTTISVKGRGLIQSELGRTDLLAPINGRVLNINLTDNQRVTKGETMLVIDGSLTAQQDSLLTNHKIQLLNQLQDIEKLIKAVNDKLISENLTLKTGLYTASWQLYFEQLQNAKNACHQTEHIYNRYKVLSLKNVVSQVEFEQHKFNYEQALSELHELSKKYKNQWLNEAIQYHNELREVKHKKLLLNNQEGQHVLKAVITGSVQNLTGVHDGAYVYANQKLGEISPDSTLFAFCYIKTADVGLIKKGQFVQFQMDAFNYNQWGMLTGKVVDISDDIFFQNQASYFKIKCLLDKKNLQLKNGHKGCVKKGMAFTANFTIAKRSLFQLLSDKISDWL